MADNRERAQQHQTGTGNAENPDTLPKEQFNELSELSLEERMNVADQIGIPVNNLGDAAATGTMQDRDNAASDPDFQSEENRNGQVDQ